MNRNTLVISFGLALLPLSMPIIAANTPTWSSAPMLVTERVKGGDRRSQSLFRPVNMTSQKVMDFASSQNESIPKPLSDEGDGRFSIKTRGRGEGNYHWISAEGINGQRYASTVHYFSNPGPAPRKMLKQNKLGLELKPVDLPREHQQFRSNENWSFQALSQGKPVANATVLLETSNGTTQQFTTNNSGLVSVLFPDDFKSAKDQHKNHAGHAAAGHMGHRRQSAKFVLSLQHDNVTTAFNYKYRPDAFTNKTVLPAAGLLFTGSLITGFVLFRRRKS